jgi:hypothetical protein
MRQRQLSRWSKRVVETQATAAHCAVTLSHRLPMFGGFLLAPSAATFAEFQRAYAEKVAATMEGAVAATAEWQAAMFRSAFRVPTPAGLVDDLTRVMDKAARPARRAVKANASRLTKAAAR